jgi:hypothetical protein
MNRKLPMDAFDYYLTLGVGRSYQAVADKYGVSKVAVTARAKRDGWQGRIQRIEEEARKNGERRAIETRDDENERRLKYWQAVERRALETVRAHPFETVMDAVRGLDLAMKNIRLIQGEPTERREVSVEEITKREVATLLEVVRGDDESDTASQQDRAV